MSPLKKIADQNLPKTFHQKPNISTSYSSSSSEANSPIKTSKFVEQISPTNDALQANFSLSKSSNLQQRSTFKEQLEQKLQQKKQQKMQAPSTPQKPVTPPKPAPRSPQKQAPITPQKPGPSTPKRPAPSAPTSTPSASVQKIVTEEKVLSHATPDVDLKPEVSSLSSDSEQNWDKDTPVKIRTIEHSNKGSKLSEQSKLPGNSSELLF